MRALKQRSADGHADSERFVVEGEIAVRRLLGTGIAVELVVGTPARAERLRAALGATPFLELSARDLSELVGFDFHRGCVAVARRPHGHDGTHSRPLPPDPGIVAVVLEAVCDPANVGAVARNCRAFGVERLVVDHASGDPYARRAIRAAMGHVLELEIERVRDLVDWIAWQRTQLPGLQVIAATPEPMAQSIGDTRALGAPAVMLLGNEGTGLSEVLRAHADHELRIPIFPGVDSINVAATSAIILHVLGRARGPSPLASSSAV